MNQSIFCGPGKSSNRYFVIRTHAWSLLIFNLDITKNGNGQLIKEGWSFHLRNSAY